MWNIAFLYLLPVESEWNAALSIPLNLTVASLMGCRLFRELKLGLLTGDLTRNGSLSSLVFRDLDNIRSVHEIEMQTFPDIHAGTGRTLRHGGRSDEDIESGGHGGS